MSLVLTSLLIIDKLIASLHSSPVCKLRMSYERGFTSTMWFWICMQMAVVRWGKDWQSFLVYLSKAMNWIVGQCERLLFILGQRYEKGEVKKKKKKKYSGRKRVCWGEKEMIHPRSRAYHCKNEKALAQKSLAVSFFVFFDRWSQPRRLVSGVCFSVFSYQKIGTRYKVQLRLCQAQVLLFCSRG